jgi:chromosome partitioning protein
MGDIIATVNMKGGVSKTTLAACLAKHYGQRVLVIDLDSQFNATLCLIAPGEFTQLKKANKTLSSLLKSRLYTKTITRKQIDSLVQQDVCQIRGLDLIAGDFEVYDDFIISEYLCYKFVGEGNKDFEAVWGELEKSLVDDIVSPLVKDYDFIFLDCAPGYDILTRSAIVASDFYLIPNLPEQLSWFGTQLLQKRIQKLKNMHKSFSQLIGIVFRRPANVASSYEKSKRKFIEDFGINKIFRTEIPTSVVISEAAAKHKPVVLTAPSHAGSRAFRELTEEFLEKLSLSKGR